MTIEQILTDITSVLGAVGVISTVLAHLPLPAKYAQFFARLATYAANAKFSVNVREKPKDEDVVLPPRFPGAGGGVAILLAIGCVFHASACTPKSAADVPHDVAIAYAAANAALEVADSAETAYLDSLASPTQEQIDRSAAVVEKLRQARGTLAEVHDDFAHGRAKLLEALSDLQAGADLASALGVKVPDKVGKALAAAEEALK